MSTTGIVTNATSIFPTDDPAEWDRDHREFVCNVLLPMIRPRPSVDQVIRWAYNAGMEKRSDGSSCVPDYAYRWGNIKDPMGVGHDYLFELHHLGVPDPMGHYWTLVECNLFYLHGWIDFGYPGIGAAWFTGLCIGSWVPWCFGG